MLKCSDISETLFLHSQDNMHKSNKIIYLVDHLILAYNNIKKNAKFHIVVYTKHAKRATFRPVTLPLITPLHIFFKRLLDLLFRIVKQSYEAMEAIATLSTVHAVSMDQLIWP